MSEQFERWAADQQNAGVLIITPEAAWEHVEHLRKNDIAAAKMLLSVLETKDQEIEQLKRYIFQHGEKL